jgi:membrane-bound lytic murein transglycosylase D
MPASRLLRRLGLVGVLGAAPVIAAPRPAVEESAAERRAVRGVSLDAVNESPELRELRRFEEQAFPRSMREDPAPDADAPFGLPPGLEGHWRGSGDIPAPLRSPPSARTGAPPPTPAADWLRSLTLPELPVRWEPQVIRFLEWFKNDERGHRIMSNWLRKLGRYQALYDKVLEREGVPADLVYLSMIESGFEPGAVSRVGAGGLWQFMPGAGRAYGLEVSHWVDARRDPEKATVAAARYLKDLYVRFGSWSLAFAAYHAGYGGVLKSITRFNTNDYWELCRHEAGLPWETTLYVPKILAAAIIGHNRRAFGFEDVPPDPPWAYDTIEVPAGTTLVTVAKAAGARPEVIESLNAELVRGRTPPDRAAGPVRLPVGTAGACAQGLASARAPADQVDTVVLRFGESLEDVARTRGIPLRELKKLNGVRDLAEVRPGATIVCPPRASAAPEARRLPVEEDLDEVLVAVPERTFSYADREQVFYRTREGDTLDEIAQVFHVRVDDLVEWNSLDPDANLHPRLVLQIFVARDFDRAGIALLDSAKVRVVTIGSEEFLALEAARRGKTRLPYVAHAGDTLAKIARRYGLQPGDLARINRLSYSSELREGQTIYVYSPTPELPREIAAGRAPARQVRGGLPQQRPGKPATVIKPVKKAEPPRGVARKGRRHSGSARR